MFDIDNPGSFYQMQKLEDRWKAGNKYLNSFDDGTTFDNPDVNNANNKDCIFDHDNSTWVAKDDPKIFKPVFIF